MTLSHKNTFISYQSDATSTNRTKYACESFSSSVQRKVWKSQPKVDHRTITTNVLYDQLVYDAFGKHRPERFIRCVNPPPIEFEDPPSSLSLSHTHIESIVINVFLAHIVNLTVLNGWLMGNCSNNSILSCFVWQNEQKS